MKVVQNTPDLLVLRFTRWKGPAAWAALSLLFLGAAAALVWVADVPFWTLVVWLSATAFWTIPMVFFRAERMMLVLATRSGSAELHRRDITGLHRQVWPLDEVQSTRVTRRYRATGPAAQDAKHNIALFVRDGMDEGRHPMTKFAISAPEALAISAQVSDWMKAWPIRVDSNPSKP